MRRIETREAVERRRKRNNLIVSSIMLAILLLGTVGYAFSYYDSGSSSGNQGGGAVNEKVSFDSVRGQWVSNVGGGNIYFSNSPEEVKGSEVDIEFSIDDYKGRALYVDSESNLIANEILSTLGLYTLRAQEACYGECEKNLPAKNCSSDNLIVFRESENDKAYQEDSCVFIEGNLKTADAFLYRIFGISE